MGAGERRAPSPSPNRRLSRPRTIPESSGGDVRGSIRAKVPGKRYEVRVALGRDPKTGRYRQKSLTVHGSKAEAQPALRALLADLEAGSFDANRVEQDSATFAPRLLCAGPPVPTPGPPPSPPH